jgi:hypothetical protein
MIGLKKGKRAMNNLLVYYSATGNGDAIAKYLKERGCPSLKLELKKPIGKVGFFKMFHYGYRAIKEAPEELAPYEFDSSKLDTLYLASPIWGGRISTPLLTFLKAHPEIKNQVKVVFLSSMSGKLKKAPEQIKRYLPLASIVNLESPLSDLDEMKRKIDQAIK